MGVREIDRSLEQWQMGVKDLRRRMEKVNAEWSLICTGHNPESSSGQALLKLFRCGRLAPG